jgi:hypothetical protein
MAKKTLEKETYLCPITGQDTEVSGSIVQCSSISDSGNCQKSLPNMISCSVYIDASRAYIGCRQSAQSQPKCTERRIDAIEPGYSATDD